MSAPKQNIDLKQQQQLTLTPQLKQSLHILMLNQAELEQEIELMLEKNVMLERVDSEDNLVAELDEYSDAAPIDRVASDTSDSDIEINDDNMPDDLAFDANWQDFFEAESEVSSAAADEGIQFDRFSNVSSFDEILEIALIQADFSPAEQVMVEAVVNHLDENYLLTTISVSALAKKIKVSVEDLNQVVEKIRHLDPPGVASKDIAGCMLAKLHVLNNCQEPYLNAHEIIENYLPFLGQKDTLIRQRLGISETEFNEAIYVIRSLSPYPFEHGSVTAEAIKPDVYVRKRMGFYYASMNIDKRHDLAINEEYALLSKASKGDEKTFITSQLQEAKWFIQALDKRQKTVLRVANAIVMHQQPFFVEGETAMKPLSMATISEQLEVNESTISRAVNGKYLSFNHKLYELRYFFSQQLGGAEASSDVSTTSVKSMIKSLIEAEKPQAPLSDTALEIILKEQGIDIARRTIAKYREGMGIAPSSKRKRKK